MVVVLDHLLAGHVDVTTTHSNWTKLLELRNQSLHVNVAYSPSIHVDISTLRKTRVKII